VVRKRAVWLAGAGLGLALVAPFARAAESPELRIEDAVTLALSRNERAKIADLNVTVADAAVARARTAFFPTVLVGGTLTYKPDDIVDPKRSTGSILNSATTSMGATATLNQPLLNASSIVLYLQAKQVAAGTEAQTVDDKRLLAFDAAKAFFAALSADAVLTAANTRLTTAQANLNDTQERVDARMVSTNDATRAQIDLANAQREVESDKGIVQVAYVALAFTINAPVPAKLTTPSALLAAGRAPVPQADSLVRLAIATRPDLASKRHLALAAHDFAREPLLRLIPTLNLTGSFGLSTDQTLVSPPFQTFYNSEQIGLALAWPLFDAGVRYADKRSRDAQASIADLTTDTLVRSVDAQVRESVYALVASQNALDAAARALAAAKRSADETTVLYKQGIAKAIELVDANDSRFLAEVNFITAEYSVALAYLALRQAVGLDAIGTELR
jgi:outer membrane protein TolC